MKCLFEDCTNQVGDFNSKFCKEHRPACSICGLTDCICVPQQYLPEAFAKQFSYLNAEANAKANEAAEFSGNKYHRKIIGLDGTVTTTDVYRVLDAFDVREPGLQHAIKKLLCAGIRGKNDTDNDLKEAIDAITATRLAIKQKIGLQS